MNAVFGLSGLPAANTVADFISILVTAVMAVRYYKKVTVGE